MNVSEAATHEDSITISTSFGDRIILLSKMDAMSGWECGKNLIFYAQSREDGAAFRKDFTLKVISEASIQDGESFTPLSSESLVNQHLESWLNVELVFNAVLKHNGFDPDLSEEKAKYWDFVGTSISASFLANAMRLMEPLMDAAETNRKVG